MRPAHSAREIYAEDQKGNERRDPASMRPAHSAREISIYAGVNV